MNKSDEIYNYIRDEITHERMCVNQKIKVTELARQFEVSKIVVKTALKKLEYQGWVYSKSKSGTYVAPLESEELKENFQVRMLLEPNIVVMAVPYISKAELNQLHENCQLMSNPSISPEEFLKIEKTNHKIIENNCPNRVLVHIVEDLNDSYSRLGMITRDPRRRSESVSEWEKITMAVENKDSELAKFYMIRHIINATEEFWTNVAPRRKE